MKKNALAFLSVFTIITILTVVNTDTIQAKESRKTQHIKAHGIVIRSKHPAKLEKIAKEKHIKLPNLYRKRNGESIFFADINVSSTAAKLFGSQPDTYISQNYTYTTTSTPNDPKYSDQWNLRYINASKAWDLHTGNPNVIIAVIDTGILFNQTIDNTSYIQPDFPVSRMWTNINETGYTTSSDACWSGTPADKSSNGCDDDSNGQTDDWRGWDFMGGWRGQGATCPNYNDTNTYNDPNDSSYVSQDNDPQPYSCDNPLNTVLLNKNHYDGTCSQSGGACYIGHGTMVASIAASSTNNSQLIAGIDQQTSLMNIRALDGYGYGSTAQLLSALYYAIDQRANVINLSLATGCGNNNFTDPAIEAALQEAYSANIVSVAASGNDGDIDSICYPASSNYTISVGAINSSNTRESFSNYSNKLDVVAPSGVPVANAPSAAKNNTYSNNEQGTSISTPHVAGLISLILGAHPSLTSKQVFDVVRDRADKLPGMNRQIRTNEYGYGRINLYTTLAAADGLLPVYQLYRPATKNHFYTTSVSERDNAVEKLGFQYNKIAYWAHGPNTNLTPVYRLYRPTTRTHFYTIDAKEKDLAVQKLGYKYEGIRFRVDQSNSKSLPIYRLYRSSTRAHFYTQSKSERDSAVANLGYKYEGIRYYTE